MAALPIMRRSWSITVGGLAEVVRRIALNGQTATTLGAEGCKCKGARSSAVEME